MGIFFTILYQPLFNLLVFFYNVIPGSDIGLAIIALTLFIRIVLIPVSRQQLKSQKSLQDIQPKVEGLKKEYKDDKEGLAKAMMELYKEEKVSPFSSCLPLIIQLVILFALYRVLLEGLGGESLDALYPFIEHPGQINTMFLGFVDLTVPNIPLAVLAGIVQYFQAKMMMTNKPPAEVEGKEGSKDESMMASMNKSMLYFMPVITVVIGATFPGGLALYWFVSNLFMVIQQVIIFGKKKTKVEVVAE